MQRPPVPDENLLINELIREYLAFNKYRNTLSVLITEAGQPAMPLDRDFLADRTGAVEDGNSRQLCALDPALSLHLLARNLPHQEAGRRGLGVVSLPTSTQRPPAMPPSAAPRHPSHLAACAPFCDLLILPSARSDALELLASA